MKRHPSSLRVVPLVLLLAASASGAAGGQSPRLLRDIETEAPDASPFSQPRVLASLGTLALLRVSDPVNGFEPWVSDGTPDGTRLLVDLSPGPFDSEVEPLWTSGGRVVFTHGEKLWSTDGTSTGTVRLPGAAPPPEPTGSVLGELTGPPRLIYPGPGGDPSRLVDRALWATDGTIGGTRRYFELGTPSRDPLPGASLGGTLLFVRETPETGEELWRTDGTGAGTGMVADVLPGDGSSNPRHFAVLDSGVALFAATGPTAGRELWRSDGTAAGTRRVADLTPGPGHSNILFPLQAAGSRAFFLAEPLLGDTGSLQLWVSDGTENGTGALTAFASSEPFGDRQDLVRESPRRAQRFQVIGDRLYFVADDGAAGRELWISDGTLLGTRRLADLCPGSCASDPLLALEHLPGIVLFEADDGTGRRPWVTDGTASGTRPLISSCSGPCPGATLGFRSDGRRAFFVAVDDPGFQRQLWVTDGTASGTGRLTDFGQGAIGLQGTLDQTGFADGAYLFAAHDPEHGTELWRSDGTAAGTGILADLASQKTRGSSPAGFTAAGALGFFVASELVDPSGLWVTDGTAAGTRSVRDLASEIPARSGASLVATRGSRGLFVTDDGRLRVTDGTPAGTRILGGLGDFATGGTGGSVVEERIGSLTGAVEQGDLGGATVFFLRRELWVTDGTAEGTGPIADLQRVVLPAVGPFFAGLRDGGPRVDRVILAARSEQRGIPAGLWITDGTAAGTRLITDGAGEEQFRPQQLTAAGELVFFGTRGGAGGFELWVTDGTIDGTGRLPAPLFDPLNLTAVGSRVFFTARSSLQRRELWVSDGTAEGTRVVAPVPREGRSTRIREAAAFGGRLLFVPDDGLAGHEPWVTDGTPAGTRQVVDLWPGFAGSEPDNLVTVGDRVVFSASTPDRGRELWITDGTAAGTVPLFDLIPGPGSSRPRGTILLGDTLVFGADDGVLGQEPWALDLGGRPPPPAGPWLSDASLPGFRVKVRITPGNGPPVSGAREPICIPETLCVSGALPGRSEVFVRVVGPKPNGRLWPTLVKFSTSQVEVWIEQLATGEVEYYVLEGARPGVDELPGLFDREGFPPV